jgi:HEAT repeat protein
MMIHKSAYSVLVLPAAGKARPPPRREPLLEGMGGSAAGSLERASAPLPARDANAFRGEFEGMASPDPRDRICSSYMLGEAAWEGLGWPMLALSLAGGLSDAEERVRANCARGLAGMASRGARIGVAVQGLGKGLDDEAESVRINSAAALFLFHASAGDERAMERLLNHARPEIRATAKSLLGHISVS